MYGVYDLQREMHYQAKRKVIKRYETSIFMNKRGAFTLIELLVVIAIIALLMGVLMPALMRAKEAGKTVKCQANLRTLTTAWYTYAMDNDDRLCGSWN